MSLPEGAPRSSVVTRHWCPWSGRAQWRLHAAWALLCPWSSQTPVGPLNGSRGLCKWRLLQQPVGDVPVLSFASDGLLPSLKKGCVAARCGWVSPLSLGSASSLCQLTQSGGCGHRDASVSLPAQPDPVGKKLVFVSSCFCVKYLLVCSKDGYFFLLFLSSDPLTTQFAGWQALEQRPLQTPFSFVDGCQLCCTSIWPVWGSTWETKLARVNT